MLRRRMHFLRSYPRLAAVLLASVALVFTACYRSASDASFPTQTRYAGHEPWTVDGVRPGQTFAEVQERLGEPRDVRETYGRRFARWAVHDIAVSFDPAGRVTEVMGATVKAGDKVLVWSSSSEADVTQILGPGKVQKSYRPKGGGVISLGREHIGTTLVYDNAGVRFELCVFGDAAGHFLARQQP